MRIEGLERGPETAQGKVFFEWLRLFSRMAVGGMIQAYEGEYGEERYVTDAHKTLFVYGWGYCDTTSRIAEAAWQEFKHDPESAQRVCVQHADGGYHTMYRLRMNGAFGAFDPRYGYYLLENDSPEAKILDWAEVGRDENILRNREYRHRCRPFFEIAGIEWDRALLLEPAYFASENAWRAAGAPKETVFGDPQYRMGTDLHNMDFVLHLGTTIERYWNNHARKFYVPAGQHTKREYPFLPSGRFYRITETSRDGNWPKYDPNHARLRPYLTTVPIDEGYPAEVAGGRSIGQAWGQVVYRPDLAQPGPLDIVIGEPSLVHSKSAPFLRPRLNQAGGQAILDFDCPYIMVDGLLKVQLEGSGVRVDIRALRPKAANASEPDVWSAWQTLVQDQGVHQIELGRKRFNGSLVSIHGRYRFQLRIAVDELPGRKTPAGLSALSLEYSFENGIMSIPQIFAGSNTVHFRLSSGWTPRAPVTVEYRYQTAAGERAHRRTLSPANLQNGDASYVLDAPGLLRCNSVSITY